MNDELIRLRAFEEAIREWALKWDVASQLRGDYGEESEPQAADDLENILGVGDDA